MQPAPHSQNLGCHLRLEHTRERTGWSRLGHLVRVHPPRLCCKLGIPGAAVDDGHVTGLVQRFGRNLRRGDVLDDDTGGAVQVSVDVNIILLKIPPNQEFVLLPVSARNDEVVLGAYEPEKLFEPVRFARLTDVDGHLQTGASIGHTARGFVSGCGKQENARNCDSPTNIPELDAAAAWFCARSISTPAP